MDNKLGNSCVYSVLYTSSYCLEKGAEHHKKEEELSGKHKPVSEGVLSKKTLEEAVKTVSPRGIRHYECTNYGSHTIHPCNT